MEVNLVVEALKFMALGMGTVFTFLILMIVAMNLQSKIVHRFFPEPNQGSTAAVTPKADDSKAKKVAAISAAIMHHKKING